MGCGVRFTWKDVEIVGRPKPAVRLSGRTAAFAEREGAGAIDLSMTHSRELAAAICVVVAGGKMNRVSDSRPTRPFSGSSRDLSVSDVPSSRLEVYEPLYSASEMRAAEERYPGYPDSIPELIRG